LTAGDVHGVLVVDKPAGPTSHDIVDRVRRAFRERRVGHTGTLDPFATGVLVTCVGKATRLARFLAEGDKVYRATVRLGFATTTDDLTGEALGPPVAVTATPSAVVAAARSLTGELEQRPPAYSAKRKDGRRLYEMARAGEVPEIAPVRVTVAAFDVVSQAGERVEVEVRCSPGTYIRALARDLGASLGVGGHLVALRRLESGGFAVDAAVPAAEIEARGLESLVPLRALLPKTPFVRLSAHEVEGVSHGRALDGAPHAGGPAFSGDAPVRLLDESDNLVGIGFPRVLRGERVIQPEVVLI
jgi:tRNA pseudouridine55 synthase